MVSVSKKVCSPIRPLLLLLPRRKRSRKRSRNRNPLLRTVLFALFNVFCYEAVNLVYMYLSGAALSSALIMRGLTDLFATTALTAIIMIPVRKFLGFRKKEEEQAPDLRFDHRPERDAL